jgi:hypothetical protein
MADVVGAKATVTYWLVGMLLTLNPGGGGGGVLPGLAFF